MDPCGQVSSCETCVRQVSWVGWNMLPSPYLPALNTVEFSLGKFERPSVFSINTLSSGALRGAYVVSKREWTMVSCGFWWSDASDHGVFICDFWRLLDKSFETSVFCRSGCYRPSFYERFVSAVRLEVICLDLLRFVAGSMCLWAWWCCSSCFASFRLVLPKLTTMSNLWKLDLFGFVLYFSYEFSFLPGQAELELARLCQLQTRASKVQRKMRCVRSRCSFWLFCWTSTSEVVWLRSAGSS